MLSDIAQKHIDYVVVFKLSQFGRNAKDVLVSLSHLQRYGTNLICKEDGLDSNTSMGRMMITILGAVAEMERENILAQSMLGREEKAKQGGWNGGIPPYGYVLQNGKLEIHEEDAKIIALIYDKFVNEKMGYSAIVGYLNQTGIPRHLTKTSGDRQFTDWDTQHVRLILKNPVYTGRVAFGRTKQVRIEGTESEYRRVKSKDYIVSPEAAHPAIVSDELFEKAQLRQREIAAGAPRIGRGPKHLLSGILRCPQCGSGMMAEHGRIKKGKTEPTLNYLCGHYSRAKGGQCKKNSIPCAFIPPTMPEKTPTTKKMPFM